MHTHTHTHAPVYGYFPCKPELAALQSGGRLMPIIAPTIGNTYRISPFIQLTKSCCRYHVNAIQLRNTESLQKLVHGQVTIILF